MHEKKFSAISPLKYSTDKCIIIDGGIVFVVQTIGNHES